MVPERVAAPVMVGGAMEQTPEITMVTMWVAEPQSLETVTVKV